MRPGKKQKRQVVTATIDGQVVSWENNWFGGSPPQSTAVSASSVWSSTDCVTATIAGQVVPTAAPTGPMTSSVHMVTATIDGVVVSVSHCGEQKSSR